MRARRLIVILVFAAGCSAPSDAPPPPAAAAVAPAASRPSTLIAADLPALPPGLDNAARAPEVVRTVYEFAARHPEVLQYIPCFCGCERMGHRGNDDCFVSSRNKTGQVAAWESHGMICEVCIDVAQMSMQMHNSGASTAAIRDAVEKRYGSKGTPTPRPPRGGG